MREGVVAKKADVVELTLPQLAEVLIRDKRLLTLSEVRLILKPDGKLCRAIGLGEPPLGSARINLCVPLEVVRLPGDTASCSRRAFTPLALQNSGDCSCILPLLNIQTQLEQLMVISCGAVAAEMCRVKNIQ